MVVVCFGVNRIQLVRSRTLLFGFVSDFLYIFQEGKSPF